MNIYALIILFAIIGVYALSILTNTLNLRCLRATLPREFTGIFDETHYAKSQKYTRTLTQFDLFEGGAQLLFFLTWWQFGGFEWLDQLVRGFGYGSVLTGLSYIGLLLLGSAIFDLPFKIYSTFIIEEKYGFNRTTPRTFATDILKNLVLVVILGGILFTAVLSFFEWTGSLAWLWCWLAVTVFTLVMHFLAPTLIMPLFNKFTPLQPGPLQEALFAYARAEAFPLKGIFIVDGSRRSSKANAFFTGLGQNKRIGLFDTLVKNYSVDELVAVVAHEIGHYKKGHIIKGMALQIIYMGTLFYVMSLVLQQEKLFEAFYLTEMSIYAGLVFFGLLFTPIEQLLSLIVNAFSRKNEFEADAFAAETTGNNESLISALKKLSADSLSNLTPHPLHVFLHYSHPPVLRRIEALRAKTTEA